MMNALILADIQNDFLPGGALAVPNGDEVIPVANRAMQHFDLVVATQDWHPANHGSFASQHPGKQAGDVIQLNGLEQILWPDHCVQETFGAELPAGLNAEGIDEFIRKGTDPEIDSYSAFFDNGHRQATGLDDWLRSHKVRWVCVMGLTTDYCVRATAIDAAELGYPTSLILEGTRGVDLHPGDVAKAIGQMRQAGVRILQENQLGQAAGR